MVRATFFAVGFLLLCPVQIKAQNIPAQYPPYNNNGYPDFAIDINLVKDVDVVDRLFKPTSCEVEEGTIIAVGTRRLVRFSVGVMNRAQLGTGATIGHPGDVLNPYYNWFVFDSCHQHYHIRNWASYTMLDSKNRVVGQGHKQSFCIEDVLKYDDRVSNPSRGYDCGGQWWTPGQGITAGWADIYDKTISGQWIDVTGLPSGTYTVRVTVNVSGMVFEGENRYSNTVEFKINLPSPTKKVPLVVCNDVDLYCGG